MKTLLLSASIVAFMSAGIAHAQTAPATENAAPQSDRAAATDNSDMSSDVVVTAERRATSLQRTSVAATVLTGEDLVKKSVTSVDQLQFATPSLTVNNAGQGNEFNIRGIGKGELGSALGVGVITYRDGVATFPGYFQDEPYYDISSVEVLRGPQGTFAGGNATGGAVFITEATPELDHVGGYALAQYGNYNDAKIQGALNLPISETLALRVATNEEWRDSFFHVSGPWTGNPGDLRSYSGRVSLLWQPDSHLRVLIKGDYNNIENGGYPASPASVAIGGTAQPNPTDPFHVVQNTYLNGRDEFGRIVANIAYTTDGGVVFRSITGYQKGTVQENVDADGTYDPTNAATFQTFSDHISERIWSQELNIVSPDHGPFTWLLGGYYQNDLTTIPSGDGYDAYTPITPTIGYDTFIAGTNPKTALAAFGQVGYQLTSALQLTVGARWSRTTSRNDAVASAPALGLALNQHDFTANKKATGKVALNWTVNADNFLYAFVATGSKAGGLNGPNLFGIQPLPFGPENVTDYELGWKGTWAGGHMRTQLGGYYNRYTGFQVTVTDPTRPLFDSVVNDPNPTHLYGVEFSTQGSFGHFSFDFATSLSHSDVGRFYAVDQRLPVTGVPCDTNTGPATTSCVDLGGRPAVYAPSFTLSMGAQYAIPLSDTLSLTPRLDYAHTSSTWATLFQNVAQGDHLPARDQLNAQLTLATGPWSIAAYSTNLTDAHDIVALNGLRRLVAPPRQFGVRVSRTF
jgi:iron complex outermembrane receptor protein